MAINMDTNLETQRPPQVLVIDDSIDSVKIMSHILDHYKCDVSMAFDGQDAVPLLLNKHFDLVVLDWQMPQMGGQETLMMMDRLLSEKKSQKHHRPTPVAIYTSHAEEDLELPLVKNFSYSAFINKQQTYSSMMRALNFILRSIQ